MTFQENLKLIIVCMEHLQGEEYALISNLRREIVLKFECMICVNFPHMIETIMQPQFRSNFDKQGHNLHAKTKGSPQILVHIKVSQDTPTTFILLEEIVSYMGQGYWCSMKGNHSPPPPGGEFYN